MAGKKKFLVLGILGIVTLYFTSTTVLHGLTAVESAENVESVPWLPDTASNISYSKNFNRRYFEFDVSEPAFCEWAKDYSISEISEPFHISRYAIMIDNPDSVDVDNDPRYTAVIANGLSASHTQSNHGGYSLAFDRDSDRAYFRSSSR